MKRINLFHPRVFTDQDWADGYYKRNKNSITRMGTRFVELLQQAGFQGGRILDAGCGFGTMAVLLAEAFPESEISGIDLSLPLLLRAKELAETHKVADRVSFDTGDVEQMDFETDSFDLVINAFMLHIVESPLAMLNEIERVTHPEGRVMITDLRRIWLGRFVKKLRCSYTLTEAVSIIEESTLRPGKGAKGPFWLDYFVGIH